MILTKFFVILVYFVSRYLCLDAPPIRIPNQGIVVGTYIKMFRTQNIKAYLGIPYAYAPRFSPPEAEAIKWNGVWNATAFGPDCWQKTDDTLTNKDTNVALKLLMNDRKFTKYDENCLYLNIYIPDGLPSRNGFAVVAWIQSDDFSRGSSNNINPFQLVFKQKIIIVTVSFRLNIFGFLSTGDGESQGNFGLMDQSAALFWIKKNINFFGGDDNSITLMGHAAGAVSVGLHLTSGEWSKNFFNKAILMSGNPLMEDAVKSPKHYDNVLDLIANMFGCIRRPTSLLVQCLKRVDAKIISDNLPVIDWGPVIDYGLSNSSYPFIIDYPKILFEKGFFSHVPTILGIKSMENIYKLNNDNLPARSNYTRLISELATIDLRKAINDEESCSNADILIDALRYMYQNKSFQNVEELYSHLAYDRLHAAPLYLLANFLSQTDNVFVYIFDYKPRTKFIDLNETTKFFDQVFIWGAPYMNNKDLVKEWSSDDKRFSEILMTMWANFVKSSNPTISNIYVKWNHFSPKNPTILLINESFQQNLIDHRQKVDFWNLLYPKLVMYTAEFCNYTFASKCNPNYGKMSMIVELTSVLLVINFLIAFLLTNRTI